MFSNADSSALKSLKLKNLYNEFLDFDQLEYELCLWPNAIKSDSYTKRLSENRASKIEASMKLPKKLTTREKNLELQEAKLGRKSDLPYSLFEIFTVFTEFNMEINYPQLRKLFEIYLAIPVSSSSAERAFPF